MQTVFCYDCNGNPGVAFLSNGVWLRDALDPSDRYRINVTHWLESDPPPKPDPFEEWWELLPKTPGTYFRSQFLVEHLPKSYAKVIWDAAIESFTREAQANIQSQLHETLCQPKNPQNT